MLPRKEGDECCDSYLSSFLLSVRIHLILKRKWEYVADIAYLATKQRIRYSEIINIINMPANVSLTAVIRQSAGLDWDLNSALEHKPHQTTNKLDSFHTAV